MVILCFSLQFQYVPFQTELVMAQTVSETENVDAVHTVESEVCDELQNEGSENINIDIVQGIPSSETDVDKLKKYFGRKMDNSRENDGHVQLVSMEFAKQYYENFKRENAERANDNTCIHVQQINFQNGPWKRTDSRVSVQPFTLIRLRRNFVLSSTRNINFCSIIQLFMV